MQHCATNMYATGASSTTSAATTVGPCDGTSPRRLASCRRQVPYIQQNSRSGCWWFDGVDSDGGWAGRSARGTAAKYSSKAGLRRCSGSLDAALACSMPVDDSLARGSGRRGRRFKSCHPDRVSAGQRPAPEMVRASLPPVQQQNTASTATTTRSDLSVAGLPSAWFALRPGRRGCRLKSCHPDQSSRR
jgi:hypothetical protein